MPQRARAVLLTRPIATCFGICVLIHAVTYLLNALLPLHVSALGGSKTQIGMLFSVSTMASMVLRPLVGGWTDRYGFRPVSLPGVAALLLTLTGLYWAGSPAAVVALMAGVGVANGLISTSASALVARASPPARRGEALSLYYIASSVGWAMGPPLGLALYEAAGLGESVAVAAGATLLLGGLAWSASGEATRPVPDAPARLRLWSRPALPASGALALVTLGNSSVYAFLPLYAMASGMSGNIGWFYALFSAWLIGCRVGLRGLSDRLGRGRVIAPAMALTALAYFALAIPPSVASLAAAALLLASGAALLYPTLIALLIDRAPESERGLAIGTLSASFDVGIVLGSLLVGFTVERTSYAVGFALAGALALVGLASFLAAERAWLRVVSRPSTGVSS